MLYWQDQLIELEPTGRKQGPNVLMSAIKKMSIIDFKVRKNSFQSTVHTVTSLLGRNEEEAPITTAAPYAIDSILTQSQNTYQEHHSTCKACAPHGFT